MSTKTRTNPAAHTKKRQAAHHRKTKRYLKTYWPYLPMILVIALGIGVSNIWSSNQHVLGATSNFSVQALLNDTNHAREQKNESPLSLNTELMQAAQAKAENMVALNYWSHTSPTGKTPWDFITAAGYTYKLAGENLAYGFTSSASTVTGWMNSPEHRANILTNAYQNVGFGVASSPDFQGQGPETVVVAEYAEPISNNSGTISFSVAPPATSPAQSPLQSSSELSAQPVSRIQILTGGQAIWSAVAVSIITGAAIMFILIRYWLRFKRAVSLSEAFFVHHPVIDTLIVIIITVGVVLTRTGGVIR